MKKIAIIPARGGSKGIPRKNLRPVAGMPMIYYSINACKKSSEIDRVVVTTDDDEIALFASRFGADVIMRPANLADDSTTLDPVILHAFKESEIIFNELYKVIVTVQPTSPLVSSEDINNTIAKINENIDTVLTVIDDRHLSWTKLNNTFIPEYKERVNRQSLPCSYRETGAVVACSRQQINKGTRIGDNVDLNIIPLERSFDIDSLSDLHLCESILNRKKIVFTVIGFAKVGLGHAYRTVMLANELVGYDLIFVCEEKSNLAIEYISAHNYSVITCDNGKLAETVKSLSPDLVINDILDTTDSYMLELKKENIKIVNFEDLSPSNKYANITFNALYPQKIPSNTVYSGYKYFCLRDEFIHIEKKKFSDKIENILVSFGGVDEGNLTYRCLAIIMPICQKLNIKVTVVLGPGYNLLSSLEELKIIYANYLQVIQNTKRISDYMMNADIAVTSGGRTVLELAGIGVPTMVICQNTRETTHSFVSSENGIVNLGHRNSIDDNEIENTFYELVKNSENRKVMLERMKKMNLSHGKKRVIDKLTTLLK